MSSVRSSIEEEESTPSNENDKGNKVIPAAGHFLMDQYPDKFNKILQTFLTTTNPG